MIRSAARKSADRLFARPTWLERDGDHDVVVRGYSPLDNLIYGAIAAAAILLPIIVILVGVS